MFSRLYRILKTSGIKMKMKMKKNYVGIDRESHSRKGDLEFKNNISVYVTALYIYLIHNLWKFDEDTTFQILKFQKT